MIHFGSELVDSPVYGFRGHPEASPGPQDIYHLFQKFITNMSKVCLKKST